jgi:Tfp pilus assembly protein PilO
MIKLLNKLGELKLDNKKMILIAAACLIILYIDFTFVMKLQFNGIRGVSSKIAGLKKDIANLSKDLSKLQALDKDQGKVVSDSKITKSKEVVSEDKILLVLQEISSIGNDKRVRITRLNTSKDAKAQEEVIAGEKLLPVIITLDLSCSYHAFGNFLNAIEDAQYFIEVQDIRVMRNPHDYLLENINLTLKTYAKK